MFSLIVFSSALALVSANYGGSESYGHAIDAAVKSRHKVETYPVGSSQDVEHPVVDINSGPLPLTLRFNTHSTQINAIQKHFGSPGTVQKANSVDEPDLLIQNIRKPIVQQIRESITPYRQRTQELRPVQEKIESVIATGGGHKYEPKYEPKYEEKYEPKYEPKYEAKYEPKHEPKYEAKYEPKYGSQEGYY